MGAELEIGVHYTAISRKVVGKSARNNPERYCGWFGVHCSSKKFERMVLEAMDICLPVLNESNKSRFDSRSHLEQCIDLIPYYLLGLSRARFFPTTFLEIAVYGYIASLIACSLSTLVTPKLQSNNV